MTQKTENTVTSFRVVVDEKATVTAIRPTLDDGSEPAPSLMLPKVPALQAEKSHWTQRVRFDRDGSFVRAQVAFPVTTDFYGTGEAAGPLRRNGKSVELWNTDSWGYDEDNAGLYQSHPWVFAALQDGRSVGILADSIRRGNVAIGSDGIELSFEEEPFDLYMIEAETPALVLRALTALIGRIELPPRWALGYHQCRWSYMNEDEIREVARELDERRIPCDAVWFDIDYMDRFRVFTWDSKRFPAPKALVEELHDRGMRGVAILDPGIADADDYSVFKDGKEGHHFVKNAKGKPVRGEVWPGTCVFPDFTRDKTRSWWADHVRAFLHASGLDGLWNDMNEPALFKTETQTLPEDALHEGMGGGTHARFHNIYGQLMVEASRTGFEKAYPERRPFLLTRANHISGSRFAATWTGDNQSRWTDLAWSIPMALNLGLSGQPFVGPDIGGYAGEPTEELIVRWFELGAYLPFFRGHAEKESVRKEPWAFGEEAERDVRAAIERRMRLIPTLYTLFREASRTGVPPMRPVFFADPKDPKLRGIDDAFLLGEDLLVAPVVNPKQYERRIRLPRGKWYLFPEPTASNKRDKEPLEGEVTVAAPLGTTPVFARAGSIVVTGKTTMRAGDDPGKLTLNVFLDEEGSATGHVYEDEGEGFGYRQGRYRFTTFTAKTKDGEVKIEEKVDGEWDPGPRVNEVRVVGAR